MWDVYQERKHQVSQYIKERHIKNHINTIVKNASKKSSNPKAFWKTLKMYNTKSKHPMEIIDPDDPEGKRILNDPKEISLALKKYWKNVGNKNRNSNSKLNLNCDKINQLSNSTSFTEGSLSDIEISYIDIKRCLKNLKKWKMLWI